MEGASGEWIPKMKEQFGVQAFDLVFLDHWKDRYLPDTKLIEASLSSSFSTEQSPEFFFFCCDTLFAFFRSVAFSGTGASCWQTTSFVLELQITWNMSATASIMKAGTSSLTWSIPKWRMAWRSQSS